jgi:hypothetical protein
MSAKGFKLPAKFLEQLGEFSRGYYLVVVNELGEMESFEGFDNPAIKLALINFVDAQVTAMQQHLRNKALQVEEMIELDDDDDDDDEKS